MGVQTFTRSNSPCNWRQPGYKVYQDLESLLLKVANKANYSDELSRVVSIYGSDINEANLQTQLQILGQL